MFDSFYQAASLFPEHINNACKILFFFVLIDTTEIIQIIDNEK